MQKIVFGKEINLNVTNSTAKISFFGETSTETRSSKNLYDTDTKTNNRILSWSSGSLSSQTRSITTDYIDVTNISHIASNYKFAIFWYNSSKTYLGNSANLRKTTGVHYTELDKPTNTNIKYCRLAFFTAQNSYTNMTSVTDIMVCKSMSETSHYEPYGEITEILNIENDLYVYISNDDESIMYDFALESGQKFMEGSYLAADGIHHKHKHTIATGTSITINDMKENGKFYSIEEATLNGKTITFETSVVNADIEYELEEEELVSYTQAQQSVWDNLQDISLLEGAINITSNATMRLVYEDNTEQNNTIEDSHIYVTDKYEQLIAVFDKDDEDTLINPRIKEIQNGEAVFTCSISMDNPKCKEIMNPENLYWTGGKVFSTNFDDSFEETISDNDDKIISITAYERQKLLSRKLVKAWNSETGFDSVNEFMVVVLANGDLPLRNGTSETFVSSTHLKGTSGYVLDALLYGTGWTTGTCDVQGEFDLETDQIDIYENILKVQEIWGGILVFDSVNRIVHHRDETLWLPYNGYEVRYQKNMKSLDKLHNNKIITKLCPLGESGLNIKSVNGGSIWLENYTYTETELEGIENNPDITDPQQLLRWGERKLQDLCKPSIELTVDAVLLYQLEGYELETVALNDIVDVINYNDIDNDIKQLRVISFEYSLWDKSDAVLELSDITLDSTDIFKKNVSATNYINNGTLNSSRIVSYFKNGESVNDSIRNITRTIVEDKTELAKTDEEIKASVLETTDKVNDLDNTIVSHTTQLEELTATVAGLTNRVTSVGGDNLIKNSVGYFGNDYWEGTIITENTTDVKINNEADSALKLQNASIVQNVNNLKNGIYNISFNYKKLLANANVSVKFNDEDPISLTSMEWQLFQKVETITNNSFRIEFISSDINSCLISDLILIVGQTRQIWTQNPNETRTDTVKIGKGIRIESSTANTVFKADADGTRVVDSQNESNVVAEFTDKGTITNNLTVHNTAQISGLLFQELTYSNIKQTWISKI